MGKLENLQFKINRLIVEKRIALAGGDKKKAKEIDARILQLKKET